MYVNYHNTNNKFLHILARTSSLSALQALGNAEGVGPLPDYTEENIVGWGI